MYELRPIKRFVTQRVVGWQLTPRHASVFQADVEFVDGTLGRVYALHVTPPVGDPIPALLWHLTTCPRIDRINA